MAERHVLILLDTSPASEAAIDSAVSIARHHDLMLRALFVEDQDLIASSGHAFSREISALSGQPRPFGRQSLLDRLAHQRRQIETRLDALSQREAFRWHLEVITGPVVASIQEAASQAEWIVLGKVGWSGARGGQLGSTARKLVENGRHRLLLWGTTVVPPQANVVVLVGTGGRHQPGVEVGRHLAEATGRRCHLLLLPGSDAVTIERKPGQPEPLVDRLTSPPLDALRRMMRHHPAAAVVIDEPAAEALGLAMTDLIALVDAPVIRVPALPESRAPDA